MSIVSLLAQRTQLGGGRNTAAFGLIALVFAIVAVVPRPVRSEAAENYQGPCSLAVSPDGKFLYVACADAREVAWVELPDGKVIRRAPVPAEPSGLVLTPDGTKLIVACAAPKSTVAVLAADTGKELATISTGHTAMSPAVSPDGKRLYVCNRFNNNVSVIDLAAGKELARVPTAREPIAAAVTLDGRSVLVANHLPNTRADEAFPGDVAAVVTVIDATTHETSAIQLPHGASSLRGICVMPDGKHALVTHLLSNFQKVPFRVDLGWINVNVVSVLDIQQRKLIRSTGMDEIDRGSGNPWGVTTTADGTTVCVSLAGTHELCVIDSSILLSQSARSMTPMMGVWPIYPSLDVSRWRRITLPGKGPRGLAAAKSKIYVAQYFSDSVAAVDRSMLAAAEAESQDHPTGPDKKVDPSAIPRGDLIALGPEPQWTESRRGEFLFHDASICHQQWQSCASCHPDGRVDGLTWDLMNDGIGNPKSTKSMLLSHQTPPAMAESVRMSAEEAVRSGILHILFSDRPESEAVAIDVYLKSLRPVPSPHLIDDRLTPAAERGQRLFQSDGVGCSKCHPAPLYTDLKSHNVGSRSPTEQSQSFDTPTLIESWRTAPYLHDGRYLTIKELLLEGKHGLRRGDTGLSPRDLDDLITFVLSL